MGLILTCLLLTVGFSLHAAALIAHQSLSRDLVCYAIEIAYFTRQRRRTFAVQNRCHAISCQHPLDLQPFRRHAFWSAAVRCSMNDIGLSLNFKTEEIARFPLGIWDDGTCFQTAATGIWITNMKITNIRIINMRITKRRITKGGLPIWELPIWGLPTWWLPIWELPRWGSRNYC